MKDIYVKKNKLMKQSIILNGLSKDESKKSFEIRKMQNEAYKKYKFYEGFIKAERKIDKR